jgi:hypothetical protein
VRWPVLALFERSLRVETRSLVMCLARMALPGMIMVAFFPVALMARFGRFGAPGLDVFRSTAWLDFFVVTLAGVSYFASAIAEEKEELTLGLLRMTGLGPLAILLGKSTARLVGAMLLLLVQFPFTLLAVTLGGIGNLQIVCTYAALLAYVFFLCNLALLWSVVLPGTKSAAVTTAICLALFLILPGVMKAVLNEAASASLISLDATPWRLLEQGLQWLKEASPFTALSRIFVTGTIVSPVGIQVVGNLAMGLVFFLLAWAVFERCTREQKEQAPGRGLALRWKGRSGRVPARVVGAGALVWKEFHFQAGGWLGSALRTAVLGLLYAFVAVLPALVSEDVTRGYVGGSLMVTSLVLAAVALAFDASRVFRDEVRWKTLSALAVLPLSMREVAYRKVAGSIFGMLPMLVFFLLGAILYPKGLGKALQELFSDGTALLAACAAALQFVFFLHLVAYLSLVIKRGALPLAIAIYYFGSTFLMLPFTMLLAVSRGGPESMLILVTVAAIVLTVVLHGRIGARLERAAAEE